MHKKTSKSKLKEYLKKGELQIFKITTISFFGYVKN